MTKSQSRRDAKTLRDSKKICDEQGRYVKPCRLLLLPAELRIRIYELAVVEPSSVVACYPKRVKQPALSATCQQIRRECLSVFYGDNTFRFAIPKASKVAPLPQFQLNYSTAMKHLELAQCQHVNFYYTLDIMPNGAFKLDMVTDPSDSYNPYDGSVVYCRVNSDTLAIGRRMLEGYKDRQTPLSVEEVSQLCVVLDRRRQKS
ncbi:hypothetical protein LTR56_011574 [Elasticomyces elasticus]|nr:hypothetical protein LTR56_011574 [Elasticomyces elasticus]KAK3656998.1 hypothetical protein LTR22_009499 [Elasticomyces elasticus]KAK4916221.1 hypothetical protein LTR49_015726 [Elasticomyces elasticus]KAK5764242.1 hypothetical protein LTS12_005693 [Elasticomyces elasticus]